MTYHLAVDIGGTFTDLVALDDDTGELRVTKAASSADDPVSAVLDVIRKVEIPPEVVDRFVHGTTVTTNALIERRGTRVAFITNRGFRDTIFVQNANRRDLYSLDWVKPRPLAHRYDCLEVDCRVDSRGRELRPVDQTDVDAVIEHLRSERIGAVAISLLFSFLNPTHELQIAEQLRAALPDLFVSLSHEVYPRWRENDRGHTTIADAYLKPLFDGYVANLQDGLTEAGSPARVLLMKSNGGIVAGDAAADRPVNYLVSGPVGGVLGGWHFARLVGSERIMTLDIGGTSCDVSLIEAGEFARSDDFEVEFGMPAKAPMIDIRTIGAGGGSIAWTDAGGLLRVGPKSAGASPGPACYGKGGEDATLTDANLVLGRLNAANFCGGDIPLQPELAQAAIERLAGTLALEPAAAAHAIIELANHNMVDALSVISVERGIDPREFALVAFGGAGALHAAEIARIIGIGRVIVPPYPGNTSAFGLLTAGLRTDLATTLLVRSDAADALQRMNDALVPLRQRTVANLQREGFAGEPEVEQRLEMRYFGQNYHREILIAGHAPLTEDDLVGAIEAFHGDYEAFYGYAQPNELVEVVGIIVTAIGSRSGPAARFAAPAVEAATDTTRPVYFQGRGFQDIAVIQRASLAPGETREGPAIVEEALSTTVVPPGARVTAHPSQSLVIDV